MTYNPKDTFPGAQPIKQMDIATMVMALDASADIPVVYAFGAGAPGGFNVNGAQWLDSNFTGSVSDRVGVSGAAGRLFVEFDPYAPVAP